jgi:hypothetical protein
MEKRPGWSRAKVERGKGTHIAPFITWATVAWDKSILLQPQYKTRFDKDSFDGIESFSDPSVKENDRSWMPFHCFQEPEAWTSASTGPGTEPCWPAR